MNSKKVEFLSYKLIYKTPGLIRKLFFQDTTNFLPAALTIKDQQQFQKTKSEEMVASSVDKK